MSIAFGSGPSNGQFWFGGSTFPGFMFKKNTGVGGRRSTKMNPGGNITCNSQTYLYNKYTPGANGVGASSTSNRRAKNRLATVCRSGSNSETKQCFPCQSTLGQYSNYTHNPNGYYPCLQTPSVQEPRYEVTGEYTYLPAEPGFNIVIEFTGPSTITINYSPLSVTSVIFLNGIEVQTMTVVAQPGTFNIPAGTQPNGSVVKIISKFNV
jgi:hypothetical protein